jgi:hypothetical protein
VRYDILEIISFPGIGKKWRCSTDTVFKKDFRLLFIRANVKNKKKHLCFQLASVFSAILVLIVIVSIGPLFQSLPNVS